MTRRNRRTPRVVTHQARIRIPLALPALLDELSALCREHGWRRLVVPDGDEFDVTVYIVGDISPMVTWSVLVQDRLVPQKENRPSNTEAAPAIPTTGYEPMVSEFAGGKP